MNFFPEKRHLGGREFRLVMPRFSDPLKTISLFLLLLSEVRECKQRKGGGLQKSA